jgi:hypothetical protein
MPDIIGNVPQVLRTEWYAVMDNICADINIIKSIVDGVIFKKDMTGGPLWIMVSPWADFVLNIIWQVPTFGAMFYSANQNLNGFINMLGGTFFDLGGIMSPGLSLDDEPVTTALFCGAIIGCTLDYGALSLLSSFTGEVSTD